MGDVHQNQLTPERQKNTSSSSSQYSKGNGSVSDVVKGIRNNDTKHTEQGEPKERDYVSEIRELFRNHRYEYDDLSEVLGNVDEKNFYRLLCTDTEHFVAISKESPNLMLSLYSFHPDSFKRLRLTDQAKYKRIVSRGGTEDPRTGWMSDISEDLDTYDNKLRNAYSEASESEKEELGTESYHDTRIVIDDLLYAGEYETVLPLLHHLNTYDFCDLLLYNDNISFFLRMLSEDEFVELFSNRFKALQYLYFKENEAFDEILGPYVDLINREIPNKKRFVFVRRALDQVLKAKKDWIKLSERLQSSIHNKILADERDWRPTFLIKWLGNEDMDLNDLYNIIEYAKKDIKSINEHSDVQKSCLLFAQSFPIITQARERVRIYLKNADNGKEQYDMIHTFMKTVCLSVLSAGVGSAISTGSVLMNVIVSGSVGVTIESVNQMVTGDYDLGNMAQGTGLGLFGGGVGEAIAYKFVPGPAKKFLIDVVVGTVSSVATDGARGNLSLISTDEEHNYDLDIALYAYYMAKIGGIDYDYEEEQYYVSKKLPGEKGKQQEEIVEKINDLLEKVN